MTDLKHVIIPDSDVTFMTYPGERGRHYVILCNDYGHVCLTEDTHRNNVLP